MTTPAPASVRETDGRSARSARTRDAIADALLDLLVEGQLRPTAKEIAERAGVSVRSVYVHFDDLEDLFCVAAKRQFARATPPEPATTSGPLEVRAAAVVQRRARIYTELGAVGRATQLQAPFSPTLARIVRDAFMRSQAELERVFAPELAKLPGDCRVRVVGALDALASPATWDLLREQHELDDVDAQRTVTEAIVARLRVAAE